MYLGDFVSIMNKAYTEPHAEFNGSKLHHCALVVFAIYSFENIEQQFLSCHFESNFYHAPGQFWSRLNFFEGIVIIASLT